MKCICHEHKPECDCYCPTPADYTNQEVMWVVMGMVFFIIVVALTSS